MMRPGFFLPFEVRCRCRQTIPPPMKVLVDPLPVDYLEKGIDVVGPAVLVFEILDVLPHVQTLDGYLALGQGAVLVGGGEDLQAAAAVNQPAPTAAEIQGGSAGEPFPEGIVAAAGGVNTVDIDRAPHPGPRRSSAPTESARSGSPPLLPATECPHRRVIFVIDTSPVSTLGSGWLRTASPVADCRGGAPARASS